MVCVREGAIKKEENNIRENFLPVRKKEHTSSISVMVLPKRNYKRGSVGRPLRATSEKTGNTSQEKRVPGEENRVYSH